MYKWKRDGIKIRLFRACHRKLEDMGAHGLSNIFWRLKMDAIDGQYGPSDGAERHMKKVGESKKYMQPPVMRINDLMMALRYDFRMAMNARKDV